MVRAETSYRKFDSLDEVSSVRVLLVSGIYPPDIGGPATFIPQLRSALMDRGHMPIVVTLGNQLDLSRKNGVYKIPRSLPIPFRFVVLVLLLLLIGFRSKFIYANGLHEEAGIANFLLRKKSIAKVVGDPIWEKARNNRTTNLEIREFNLSKRKRIEKIRVKTLAFSLRQFSEIHCPSRELVQILNGWSNKLLPEYRPNGVIVNGSDGEITTEKEFDLITVSRLVPWKNIDKLIGSIEGTHLSLAVIGVGPDEKILRNQAQGMKNRVTFLGSKNQSEITTLMMKSKIFVQISSYEGQSFSMLQAMSLGIPVVVSDIPGNSEVVSNNINGVILKELNSTAIKSALLNLSGNDQLLNNIGAAGKFRIISDFNLTKQFNTLIAQIEDLDNS
jgi:glycosyltransferase involved in cell wall biosynthesis